MHEWKELKRDSFFKDYTKPQMVKWYNKLHTDSSEYKMWGNGIALPCALYVLEGIAEVLNAGGCKAASRLFWNAKDAGKECPMAYKPMESILGQIGDTVTVKKIIKPIYNCKAAN